MIGFGSEQKSRKELRKGDILSKTVPQDLHKFGLIAELIGRVPVVVSLNDLDEEALCTILTEPKNALTKQYKLLLEFDNVELEFDDDAIRAIAQKAIKQETGARGLRAIVEGFMKDIMFDIPSDKTITKCYITKDVVDGTGLPKFEHGKAGKFAS